MHLATGFKDRAAAKYLGDFFPHRHPAGWDVGLADKRGAGEHVAEPQRVQLRARGGGRLPARGQGLPWGPQRPPPGPVRIHCIQLSSELASDDLFLTITNPPIHILTTMSRILRLDFHKVCSSVFFSSQGFWFRPRPATSPSTGRGAKRGPAGGPAGAAQDHGPDRAADRQRGVRPHRHPGPGGRSSIRSDGPRSPRFCQPGRFCVSVFSLNISCCDFDVFYIQVLGTKRTPNNGGEGSNSRSGDLSFNEAEYNVGMDDFQTPFASVGNFT